MRRHSRMETDNNLLFHTVHQPHSNTPKQQMHMTQLANQNQGGVRLCKYKKTKEADSTNSCDISKVADKIFKCVNTVNMFS